jgi:hypothetical protein
VRRILVIGTLLGGGVMLGATGFGGAIAGAATPFTNVIIGNTSTNPVPVTEENVDNGNIRVHEEGTATVAGTVSLGSTDSDNLDSAATHLSRIDTAASKLAFDGTGNLKVPDLVLEGPVGHGQDSYVLNLPRPVAYDSIQVFCSNPTPCKLGLTVSGTVGQP